MRSLQLGHVKNTNGFISTSISPITTTRLDTIEDQYQLISSCRYDNIIKTRSRDKFLCLIFISISPITTKLTGKMISLQWPYFTGDDDDDDNDDDDDDDDDGATISRSNDSSLKTHQN